MQKLKLNKTEDKYYYTNGDGKVVSSITFNEFDIPNFNWILLSDLETDRAYRRKGLASSLIMEVYKDIARKRGYGLYLMVKTTNGGAIKLYEELGFKKLKVVNDKYYLYAYGNPSNTSQLLRMDFLTD